jgi:hypothetical protein
MSNLMEEIHISGLDLQRWSLEFVISFPKIYIGDLGVRFGFQDIFSSGGQISTFIPSI